MAILGSYKLECLQSCKINVLVLNVLTQWEFIRSITTAVLTLTKNTAENIC